MMMMTTFEITHSSDTTKSWDARSAPTERDVVTLVGGAAATCCSWLVEPASSTRSESLSPDITTIDNKVVITIMVIYVAQILKAANAWSRSHSRRPQQEPTLGNVGRDVAETRPRLGLRTGQWFPRRTLNDPPVRTVSFDGDPLGRFFDYVISILICTWFFAKFMRRINVKAELRDEVGSGVPGFEALRESQRVGVYRTIGARSGLFGK